MIRELNTEGFEEFVSSDQPVFVYFWAEWCSPCQQVGPEIELLIEARPDIAFAKIDTDANADVAAAYDIRAIPTFVVFQEDSEVMRYSGVLRKAELNDFVEKALALTKDV